MTQSTVSPQSAQAALAVLIILHLFMLATLLAGVAPHPPATIPLFGLAPFFAAVVSALASAMMVGPMQTRAGRLLTVIAIALSLVSFGPHKVVDPAFPLIWPAVISAWVAIAFLVYRLIATRRP
ncbi:hypothetical protein [Nioella aestuarii]|uniref:hypothetical protein n=1 Tax=Nioella aestuarii TaxID=1662864 RepID=UPI003D7F47F4